MKYRCLVLHYAADRSLSCILRLVGYDRVPFVEDVLRIVFLLQFLEFRIIGAKKLLGFIC